VTKSTQNIGHHVGFIYKITKWRGFTARYAQSPYITQVLFVFKGLMIILSVCTVQDIRVNTSFCCIYRERF